MVTSAPVLKYFDARKETTLQCDASERGLGAILTLEGHPTAYVSRALMDLETRYGQIEKELLPVIFGLEKFHTFTYGRKVNVESDHKPLEVILKKNALKSTEATATYADVNPIVPAQRCLLKGIDNVPCRYTK